MKSSSILQVFFSKDFGHLIYIQFFDLKTFAQSRQSV